MLLDEKVVELDKLVQDATYLREKVGEAYELLLGAQDGGPQPQ